MRLTKLAFALLAALAACGGDDDDGGGSRPNQPGAAAQAAAQKQDSKNKLVPRVHVEDLVRCSVPDKPTGPACEPLELMGSGAVSSAKKTLAECEAGKYCLQVGAGFSCEPCAERDAIRHDFKDRDFVADQSRDPFFNFVIMPVGITDNSNNPKPEPHQSCKRRDQFVASNYSYADLHLIGIVSERTMRKVMMVDTTGRGYIIKRGDCVGKEKAVVKDIGAGYITFVIEEDPDNKRPSHEQSVPLHTDTQPQTDNLPQVAPETAAPIVAPPTPVTPPQPTGPRTGLGQSNTPPQAPVHKAPQPPVQVPPASH
jgi:Tfp pilus assembly protein PilP